MTFWHQCSEFGRGCPLRCYELACGPTGLPAEGNKISCGFSLETLPSAQTLCTFSQPAGEALYREGRSEKVREGGSFQSYVKDLLVSDRVERLPFLTFFWAIFTDPVLSGFCSKACLVDKFCLLCQPQW